jgi:starch-binding outer membrane protein, SusD/RagB family
MFDLHVFTIINERRLELAFEGHRWDDLMRAGTATTTMQALNEYTYTCSDGVQSAPTKMDYSKCTKEHWILPIPQTEIDVNPNLTQNPGY